MSAVGDDEVVARRPTAITSFCYTRNTCPGKTSSHKYSCSLVIKGLVLQRVQRDCPLCMKARAAKKFKPLYGKDICKKCYYAFANRRQFAYVIDAFLIQGIYFALAYLAFTVVTMMTVDESQLLFYDAAFGWLILALLYVMLLLKDGFFRALSR